MRLPGVSANVQICNRTESLTVAKNIEKQKQIEMKKYNNDLKLIRSEDHSHGIHSMSMETINKVLLAEASYQYTTVDHILTVTLYTLVEIFENNVIFSL